MDLINDFLNDEEKLRLFDYMQFNSYVKGEIIDLVSDEKIILQMINNDNIMSGIDSYSIVSMIEKMSDSIKQHVLHNQEFIEKHQIDSYDLERIISSLTEEKKAEVLMDIDLIKNKLHLEDYKITKILKRITKRRSKR